VALGWNWVLVIVGALLVLGEVALGGFAGFDLVLIGSSLILGGGLGLLLHNTALGYVVASVLGIAYIVLGRRWVRLRMQHRPTLSNVDALVGAQGIVTTRVAPHTAGQVRVRDELWRALPAPGAGPFEAGAEVTIQGVEGVTLQVR
jgi:membrane protein implicated in regulation of membrane protease activity